MLAYKNWIKLKQILKSLKITFWKWATQAGLDLLYQYHVISSTTVISIGVENMELEYYVLS